MAKKLSNKKVQKMLPYWVAEVFRAIGYDCYYSHSPMAIQFPKMPNIKHVENICRLMADILTDVDRLQDAVDREALSELDAHAYAKQCEDRTNDAEFSLAEEMERRRLVEDKLEDAAVSMKSAIEDRDKLWCENDTLKDEWDIEAKKVAYLECKLKECESERDRFRTANENNLEGWSQNVAGLSRKIVALEDEIVRLKGE